MDHPNPQRRKPVDGKLLANLCLKVNFKLGGRSHEVEPWCGASPESMIVGADVTHSGKGRDPNTPSLSGVVATCSEHPSQYLASARLQTNNTEHIEDLAGMMTERVLAYYRLRKTMPLNILFYRDGVSESQYGMVYLEELPQIEAGCKEAIKHLGLMSRCPKITLIVVGKRHHTRFYQPEAAPVTIRSNNLKPGLIVDHSVISPDRSSFFLQSHESANPNSNGKTPFNGHTARSSHYVITSDGIGFTPKKIQEITHSICFTGARATTSLSVCTPARYADRLCDRLRCYIRPVLEGDMQHGRTLDQYRACTTTWNAPREGRSNPWEPRLNDVMFYL
ncbi:hypothetical protein IFR05_011635 [Cadophora sp. M221]|nr:hypothetical protein IFR05_011635 [Cadophora sp. M221]